MYTQTSFLGFSTVGVQPGNESTLHICKYRNLTARRVHARCPILVHKKVLAKYELYSAQQLDLQIVAKMTLSGWLCTDRPIMQMYLSGIILIFLVACIVQHHFRYIFPIYKFQQSQKQSQRKHKSKAPQSWLYRCLLQLVKMMQLPWVSQNFEYLIKIRIRYWTLIIDRSIYAIQAPNQIISQPWKQLN